MNILVSSFFHFCQKTLFSLLSLPFLISIHFFPVLLLFSFFILSVLTRCSVCLFVLMSCCMFSVSLSVSHFLRSSATSLTNAFNSIDTDLFFILKNRTKSPKAKDFAVYCCQRIVWHQKLKRYVLASFDFFKSFALMPSNFF